MYPRKPCRHERQSVPSEQPRARPQQRALEEAAHERLQAGPNRQTVETAGLPEAVAARSIGADERITDDLPVNRLIGRERKTAQIAELGAPRRVEHMRQRREKRKQQQESALESEAEVERHLCARVPIRGRVG